MAPRPNSQNEPSSRRTISKSSKTAAASEAPPASSASSIPARSRHAKHSPFVPKSSPQTEQAAADAGSMAATALLPDQNAQQFAQLPVHFCFGVPRSPHLIPKHLAITRAQTGDMAADC